MGDKTGIEWTDATWNPTVGCSVVSPGCTNCYAMKMAHRIGPNFPHYRGLTKLTKGGPVWTGKVAAAPESTLLQPLRWKRPRRIFVNSMSDVFHEAVADETIDRIFAVMALTPQHTYQVLTKRAERMRRYFTRVRSETHRGLTSVKYLRDHWRDAADLMELGHLWRKITPADCPLPNVWLGVSAERQEEADQRIPDLLSTPAAKRFLSCEPLLGPIDLDDVANDGDSNYPVLYSCTAAETLNGTGWNAIDWVIAGGESGPRARPSHPDWFRALRDQCAAAAVPFFFKQWGEWAPGECADFAVTRTEQVASWFNDRWDFDCLTPGQSEETHRDDEPDVYRIGKRRAGALLDGREHRAFPS